MQQCALFAMNEVCFLLQQQAYSKQDWVRLVSVVHGSPTSTHVLLTTCIIWPLQKHSSELNVHPAV